MNPEPEYPVFNNYQTNINIINTIFNSNLRWGIKCKQKIFSVKFVQSFVKK
jgi:hypothetical protein